MMTSPVQKPGSLEDPFAFDLNDATPKTQWFMRMTNPTMDVAVAPLSSEPSIFGEATNYPIAFPDMNRLFKMLFEVKTWNFRIHNLKNTSLDRNYDDVNLAVQAYQSGPPIIGERIEDEIKCAPPLNVALDFESNWVDSQVPPISSGTDAFELLVSWEPKALHVLPTETEPFQVFHSMEFSLNFVFPPPSSPPIDFVAHSYLGGLISKDALPSLTESGTITFQDFAVPPENLVQGKWYTDLGGQIYQGWEADLTISCTERWDGAPC